MLPADQLPSGPQGIWQAIKQLQRDLRELRAARRLESAAIGAGGLSITSGGGLTVTSAAGQQVMRVGPIAPAHPDGSPQTAVVIRRENGAPAFVLWNATGNGVQPLQLVDAYGHIIFADDLVAGGLANPWIPYPSPTDENIAYWPHTNAGSWTTISRSRGLTHHPRIAVRIDMSTDGGTTGQIRFSIDGTVVVTASAGTPINTTVSVPSFVYQHDSEFTIDAQRLSGSGNVYAMTRYLYGVQS